MCIWHYENRLGNVIKPVDLPIRNHEDPLFLAQKNNVSIRSRPHGREMQMTVTTIAGVAACFNPLPPTWTGDAQSEQLDEMVTGVSIRSRPHGREMRCWFAVGHVPKCFNPLPPTWTGDAASAGSLHPGTVSFNPLPPTWTGDASTSSGLISTLSPVSIRSRPHGREMLAPCNNVVGFCIVFQSAPAHMDGRCRA